MPASQSGLRPIAGSSVPPAPRVRLVRSFGDGQMLSVDQSAYSGTTIPVTATNFAQVTVFGLPRAWMDNPASVGLQLWLYRWHGARASNPTRYPGARSADFGHAPHLLAGPSGHSVGGGIPSLSGNPYPPALMAIKPSEWDVTSEGQVIDVTQGCHGWMAVRTVGWRSDQAGWNGARFDLDRADQMLVPASLGNSHRSAGRRKAVSGWKKPGRFTVAWSIVDPADPRGGRIIGTHSKTFSLTSKHDPIIAKGSLIDPNPGGVLAWEYGDINPAYNAQESRFFVGTGRLPVSS